MEIDKITVDPCNVCGSTDVNLVDGYYYCVECGTQDVNVRQAMIIEERALADGTFTFKQKKKVVTVVQEKTEMPGEWHKWHAYNFILVGLADELIAAGAKPTFKKKVLWLWTEYIKKFQNKKELGLSHDDNVSDSESYIDIETSKKTSKATQQRLKKVMKETAVVKKILLLSILYVALNLDDSEIQLSDLLRFLREGRIDLKNCSKYVPKEINTKLIPGWLAFHRSFMSSSFTSEPFRVSSIGLLNCLGIAPRLPDLRKIVEKFMKELCLPEEFKNLVFALMQLVPCNYLEINTKEMQELIRFPAYETAVMAYVLVAFKMCFGLDDDYEVRLSDAVDATNDENCHLKSYKLGFYQEESDRLFSFREWCNYIQLRKIMLSKHYLHCGELFLTEIDDYVYMEQIQNKTASKRMLSEEIIMNMLDNLPLISNVEVIPKSEFKPTSSPLSTYTEIIMKYIKDPDLRLLFSEDFTKYSLKYAIENLHIHDKDGVKNILLGVNDKNKTIKSEIHGIFGDGFHLNIETVYVRNCENKNWIKTNQPNVEHVEKMQGSNTNDKDSDHGYDSNTETVASDIEANCNTIDNSEVLEEPPELERKLDLILEADKSFNIFEDEFEDVKEEKEEVEEINVKEEIEENIINHSTEPNFFDHDIENNDMVSRDDYSNSDTDLFFNPNTFDREKTIRELVLACCKKYKIKIPQEYDTRVPKPRKRKPDLSNDKARESSVKKRRVSNPSRKKGISVKDEINDIISAYYKSLEQDVLHQMSEHVRSVIISASVNQEEQNITDVNTGDAPAYQSESPTNNDDAPDNETHENENIDIHSETLEQSSIQCADDENLEEAHRKGDPRFDANKYDIKQLYVKAADDSDSDDPYDVDDPGLSAILDRKIDEIKNEKGPLKTPPRKSSKPKPKNDEDSDDDVPLSVLREEKLSIQRDKDILDSSTFEPLVKNPLEVKEFTYWIRQYAAGTVNKNAIASTQFHKELYENYPRSFYFVIRECSNIIETTPFDLYKAMLNLELRLLAC